MDKCGFPAWVRVTTDKGLVPIDKIQVGDKVLSKSENSGVIEFKSVLQTIAYENQEIWDLTYVEIKPNTDVAKLNKNKLKQLSRQNKFTSIKVMAKQLFWIEDKGWQRLDQLSFGQIIHSKKDGEQCMVFSVISVFATNLPKVSAISSIRNILDVDRRGEDFSDVDYFDYCKYDENGYIDKYLNDHDSPSPLNIEGYPLIEVSKHTYQAKVYNLKLADNDTLYIWDLWVKCL